MRIFIFYITWKKRKSKRKDMEWIKLINIVIITGIVGIIINNRVLEKQAEFVAKEKVAKVNNETLLARLYSYRKFKAKELGRWIILGVQGLLAIISIDMLNKINLLGIIEKISPYFNMAYLYSNNLNINIGYSIDGISAVFILLTITLITSCILISWRVIKKDDENMFQIVLLITEILLINFFAATDLVQLYIVYEASLIPIVIMIGLWGSRKERKIASFQILIYTLVGSIFLLMSIGLIYTSIGTTDYIMIKELLEFVPEEVRNLIFIGFFIGFAVKIPIVPLHLWLLRAHVEAPTAGSVLLAGILLKLGGYGYIRYNIGLFPELCEYYFPIIGGICLVSILYTGIATLTQLDIKRIVAYSSISHMNVVVLGLFSGVLQGIEGAIILMIGHGVVSGGLFLCIGVIYDRTKTRILYAYNNLVHMMPVMSILFFLLVLGNIAFPITSNFVGELLIFIGLIKKNIVLAFLSALSMILTAIYTFWLYNRIFFVNEAIVERGNREISEQQLKEGKINVIPYRMKQQRCRTMNLIVEPEIKKEKETYADINIFEFASIALMIIWMLLLGIKPNMVEELIKINSIELISRN